MVEWPDGPRLFEHLRDLPAPFRVADLPGYLRSLGLSNPSSSKTLQGASMHHRGEHLGSFFLGDKENGRGVHGRGRGDPRALRLTGRRGDREREDVLRRGARAGRPRSPGRDLAGRGRGPERGHGVCGLAQPRGEAHRRGDPYSGLSRRTPPRGDDVPLRRRAGVLAGGAAPLPAARGRHGDARRGDRALGARRAERPDASQRHAHSLGRRRPRVGRRHDAGPGPRSRSSSGSGRSSSGW